jgi:hypothetical protein
MSKRRRVLGALAGALLAEGVVPARRRGTLFGIRTVVRCHRGHVFTTLWIPGVSFKSVRLAWWRFQRCPVGPHWGVVTPVDVSKLGARQRLGARRLDSRIP